MKKLLLLVLALTCFACSAESDLGTSEPVASLEQPLTGCVLFPWSDDALNPLPGQPSGTRVYWTIVNHGDAACSFLTQAELRKNGTVYTGREWVNSTPLAPVPNAGTPTPSRSFRESFPVGPACEYRIWIKRAGQSWQNWGWTNCVGL